MKQASLNAKAGSEPLAFTRLNILANGFTLLSGAS